MNTDTSRPQSVHTCCSNGWRLFVLTGALCALPFTTQAALTDIASVPLASSSTTVVKPNILFTLDDSGSMDWNYMPDGISGRTGTTGFKSHLCNSIYYNPAIVYVPPKNADGTDFPNSTFTNAKNDGFDSGSSTRNLSTSFRAHSYDYSQPAYYYVFDLAANGGVPPSDSSTSSNTGCWPSSSDNATHTTGRWTKRQVTSTSGPGNTDERQNFANWYTYYSTRMQMMKSAAGRAFVGINAGYRVGFITINPGGTVSSSKYLAISDFDATQKNAWFAKLYAQSPSGGTPLREALSRAGRHFAGIQTGINNGMNGDPMQYSCQQNFTILTTDGYWNGNEGMTLTGESVGSQDSNIAATPRPLYDGGSVTAGSVKTTEKFDTNRGSGSYRCSSNQERVRRITQVTYSPTPLGGQPPSVTDYVTGCMSSSAADKALQGYPNTDTGWSPVAVTTSGSADSLSDVAAYYYNTDLRAPGSIGTLGIDVGTDNNVPSGGINVEDDSAKHQHMTTFTMGLGLAGTLNYLPNYKSGAGDFTALRNGTKN